MSKITKRIRDYKFYYFSDRELLEIFPDAKELIPEKIREWQEECDEIKNDIRAILDEAEKIAKKDFWFYEIYVAELYLPKLRECERHILRLKMFFNFHKKKNAQLINFREKIEIARNYPVYELARDKLELRPSGKNFIGLCPFHDEKTPSFYLYTETNTFVCFGCNEKGDVIKLCMYLYGLDFKETVQMLQK